MLFHGIVAGTWSVVAEFEQYAVDRPSDYCYADPSLRYYNPALSAAACGGNSDAADFGARHAVVLQNFAAECHFVRHFAAAEQNFAA